MHGDGHISGNGVAGSDGIPAGDRLDCTGQRLKRAVQCHLSGLPHVEGSSVLSGEGDGQCHGAVVADGGDGLPLTDLVPLFDIQCVQRTGGICLDYLVFRRALIAALGLRQGDLRLFDVGGGVLAVNLIEHAVLFHHIALLKVGREDLAFDQGGHSIGIGGLEGTAAGKRVGNGPWGDLFLCVGDCRR